MSSLTLLNTANLQVDTFKPTTPRLYKSLITKPGESNTLLFGDSMEDQMRSLETKEKLQKALEPEAKAQEDLDTFLQKEASAVWKGSAQGGKKLERFPPNHLQMSPPLRGNRHTPRRSGSPNDKVPFLPLSTDSSCTLGCIHVSYANWAQLTSDRFILNIIQHGITIDFINTVPRPLCHVSIVQQEALTGEINHLLSLWSPF